MQSWTAPLRRLILGVSIVHLWTRLDVAWNLDASRPTTSFPSSGEKEQYRRHGSFPKPKPASARAFFFPVGSAPHTTESTSPIIVRKIADGATPGGHPASLQSTPATRPPTLPPM